MFLNREISLQPIRQAIDPHNDKNPRNPFSQLKDMLKLKRL